MSRSTSLITGCLAIVLALPAQGSGNPGTRGQHPGAPATKAPQPSSTLLIRLRSTRIKLATANDIGAELATRKTRVRLQASKILRSHYLRRQDDFNQALAAALATFEKAVEKVQQALLGKQGARQVAALRAQSLAVSRGRGLTKAQIKQSVDPCIEELTALLRPRLLAVLEHNPKLDPAILELRSQQAQLRRWFALYASMSAGLELHDDAARHFAKYPVPQRPGGTNRIDQAIESAMFAGLPMRPGDRKTLDANQALRPRAPHQEYQGMWRLNELRYLLGLDLLRIDEKLADAARDHSKDMHTLGFFAHKSPVAGKHSFGQRAANFGTSASAENIATGQRTGSGAIRAWWYSPGHHRNMLGGHRRCGLGQHEQMWTQMFGG